jgi:hypothetical protein
MNSAIPFIKSYKFVLAVQARGTRYAVIASSPRLQNGIATRPIFYLQENRKM